MRTTKLLVLGLSMLSTSPSRALDKTYSKLPMSFEKNVGQAGAGADFIARGSGYSVSLASGEAVLALKKQRPLDRPSDNLAKHKERAAIIRMTLVGSGPARPLTRMARSLKRSSSPVNSRASCDRSGRTLPSSSRS